MQNVRWAVASTLAVALLLGCGDDVPSTNSNKGDLRIVVQGQTEAVWTTSYDFGAVPVGTEKIVTFPLTNVGSDLARITKSGFDASTPAGAFYVNVTPRELAPGATGQMTLRFVPSLVPGPNDAPYSGLCVVEHDGDSRSVAVTLSGTGVPRP